jgi:hypothetical protein
MATKICPACGETILDAAIKCRFCNTDLNALAEAQQEAVEKDLFTGRPAVLYSLGQWVVVVLTLGIAYLFYWLQSRSVKYQITTQRIKIERGLLSTTKDNVEVFRIDHFDIHKPLGMRILGRCMLHLRSSDPSFTTVILYGIPDLESLGDTLRDCSLRERKRRGLTTFVKA